MAIMAPSASSDSSVSWIDTVVDSPRASNPLFERLDALWFEDANVVVVAQTTGFRIHRSVLSRHSTVFMNILNNARGSQALSDRLGIIFDAVETVEGSPVLYVSDSAHDFTHLLRTFYDGFDYLKHTRPNDFADLAAATRLAYKYGVPAVLSEAAARLQEFFPLTLSAWDANEAVRASAKRIRPQDAIEAVNLLRALGSAESADRMLPVALYLCCQLEPGELLRGHRRADGTLETLAVDDLELCWRVQRTLVEKVAGMSERVYRPDGDRKKCKCFQKVERHVTWRWFEEARRGDPLGKKLRDRISEMGNEARLCGKCLDVVEDIEKTMRGEFWDELPRLTGVVNVET